MIEVGTLVLWHGAFARSLPKKNWIGIVSGETPISSPFGLYYPVIFPHTKQSCLIGELEVLA